MVLMVIFLLIFSGIPFLFLLGFFGQRAKFELGNKSIEKDKPFEALVINQKSFTKLKLHKDGIEIDKKFPWTSLEDVQLMDYQKVIYNCGIVETFNVELVLQLEGTIYTLKGEKSLAWAYMLILREIGRVNESNQVAKAIKGIT